jgi:hypothetical protein
MFDFKPLGEVSETYPVPPEVLTYAKEESNGNRYVMVVEPHPVVHWRVAMIVDIREGVYVRCDNCPDSHEPHVIADDYSEKVEAITAEMNSRK